MEMASRFAGAQWRKSSSSDSGGCVEVAYADGFVGVRDTKADGVGPILTFTEKEWTAFLTGVGAGEFSINELSK
jgi:hypothetical protein